MIEVENLTKRYGPTVAVDSISFEVRPQEVLGFLGPNGAGKTTTMKMLTGFLIPDEGTARIAGVDVGEDSLEVRQRIGYLPENAPLYTELNVLEYLNFICEVRRIDGAERRQRLEEMIELCGLVPNLKKDIGQLSKGFRQRVGLAQAMIHSPEVLILDEPTSGLDPNQIIDIRNLIRRLGEEKTVILSTHILPEVTATCSRVVIIAGGKIVGEGTTDELVRQADEQELVQVAVKGPADQVRERLSMLRGARQIKRIEDGVDGASRFQVLFERSPDNGERVFRMVREADWILTELRREQASLEEVFKRLTTGEVAA